MTLRERVGTALLRKQPNEVTPPAVEKLTTSGLGTGFLELFKPQLQSEKTSDAQLIKAFYGWVYANVSAIAEEVSKIEPELYQVRFEKGEIVYDTVLEHPVLDLLDKFNSVNTASEAFYITSANLELAGDMFFLKNKSYQPTELYLLDPTKMTVEPEDNGFAVKQYIYKRTVNGKDKEEKYQPDQILPLKTPNPENPLRGKSTVAAAAVTIDTSNLAQAFLKQFFENGAIVNFALTTEQRVSQDDIRRMQVQLRKEYGGVRNAFKALILGGGFDVKPVQHTNKEMAILELETAMRDKIMAMFKNTKASLGIVEDVNRANAEASLASWKNSVIKPKMMRIVDCLNEYLVPDYGDNLILGFKDPVPEDRTAKIDEATKLVDKVIAVNEARVLLGYQALPDSRFDELISARERQDAQQQAMQQKPPEKPKSLETINVDRHFRRTGLYKRYTLYKELYAKAHDLAKRLMVSKAQKPVQARKKAYQSYEDAEAFRYWEKQMSQAERIEEEFSTRLDQYLQGIEERAIDQLAQNATKAGTPSRRTKDLVDEEAEVQAALDLFTPLLKDMSDLAGTEAFDLLGLSRIYSPSRKIHETVQEFVKKMANSVVSTDSQKLEMILNEGLDQGQSVAEIEQRIRSEFSGFRKTQSENIARTEVLRASNAGTLDAFKQSGVVSKAQWYTARDDRVEPMCAELDGKIVPLGRAFFEDDYSSGVQPPLHPRCRCTLLPVIDDTKSLANTLRATTEELTRSAA